MTGVRRRWQAPLAPLEEHSVNIEDELGAILQGDGDPAEELCDLVDQFRDGRDALKVLSLLNSDNVEFISFGTSRSLTQPSPVGRGL